MDSKKSMLKFSRMVQVLMSKGFCCCFERQMFVLMFRHETRMTEKRAFLHAFMPYLTATQVLRGHQKRLGLILLDTLLAEALQFFPYFFYISCPTFPEK